MSIPKNIQIPYTTFTCLLYVMEHINLSNYDEVFREEFEGVLDDLRDKQKAIDKRELYSQLINANKDSNEDKQIDTRIEYLKKRHSL